MSEGAPSIHTAGIAYAHTIAENNVRLAEETEAFELEFDLVLKGVEALLQDPSKGHYYVVQGERDVAIAQLMITYEWSDWRCSNIWWIQSVYVQPEHRRRGLFKALYNHAKQQCMAAGACGLRLYADNDNTRAHAAYEALGMTSHYKVYEQLNTSY